MARHSQPNFVSFGADGQAQALFPGGILIPADQNPGGLDPALVNSLRFFRSDGTVVSQIYSSAGDAPTTMDFMTLAAVERTTGFSGAHLDIVTDRTNNQAYTKVGASALAGGTPDDRILLDEHGRSAFLQFQTGFTHYSTSGVESVHFAAASQSGAVNVAIPDVSGGTGVFVGALATCNSFAGGRRIFAHVNNGGTFGQIVAFADAAFTGDVDIAYIIWYDD